MKFNRPTLRSGFRAKPLLHASIWVAAATVGTVAVLFARLITWAQGRYFVAFEGHSYLMTALTPLGFVVAAGLVHHLAPEAKGSGIPQVLEAIELARDPDEAHRIWLHRLVSLRTAAVKILSTTVGIFVGASVGREGPTVQVASSSFSFVGSRLRRIHPEIDFQSFVTAGAAAGVAAAFNTPLAGVTFALEEVIGGSFGPFKQLAILGVVIAGITAQAMAGNYLYFGHPVIQDVDFLVMIAQAIPIGLVGGLAGGLFSLALANRRYFPLPRAWWLRAFLCGAVCALIGLATHGSTAGSGYEITRRSLEAGGEAGAGFAFPLGKFFTTVLSYHSGMAGGIFAPALSIGAGLGMGFAQIAHLSGPKACALIGMVAFFSGVVQAPLTAVVIVMEMSDQHALILPFMAAAFIAQGAGKLLMPTPLYHFLAFAHKSG